MRLVRGELFNFSGDFLLVTTNSTVKRDGSLVMGRGAAYQAAQMIRTLPAELGQLISNHGPNDYGVLFTRPRPVNTGGSVAIGAFQVKCHWRDPARYDLIAWSTCCLEWIAKGMPQHTFALNFPGIGNGGLRREDVLSIIETLPDNVFVYEK